MSTYDAARAAAAAKGPRAPQAVVILPPECFADDWPHKPQTPVAIGIRLIPDHDLQQARAEAAKQAIGWYDGGDGKITDEESRLDHYNDALLRWAVARATTDPNDVSVPYFTSAEDTVRMALTTEGVRRLWDELVRVHIATGVRVVPMTDADARALGTELQEGALALLPEPTQTEVRKLLTYVHEALEPYVDAARILARASSAPADPGRVVGKLVPAE